MSRPLFSAAAIALAMGVAHAQGPAPAPPAPPPPPAPPGATPPAAPPPAQAPDMGPTVKGAAACGLDFMPLVKGARWVYRQAGANDEVALKVTDISPGKDEAGRPVTAVTVEETYKDSTTILQWNCTAAGLRIPLDSFMWGGEPGDILGVKISVTDHKDYWMHPDADVNPGSGWQELIKADAERLDAGGKGLKHPPVKLELQHFFKVEEPEEVTTLAGTFRTMRFTYELRGNATIGADKADIPASADAGHFWFVRGVGPVRIEDNLNPKVRRTWELVGTNLPH